MMELLKPGSSVLIRPRGNAPDSALIEGIVRQVNITGSPPQATYEVRHWINGSPYSNWYAGYELLRTEDATPFTIGFHQPSP